MIALLLLWVSAAFGALVPAEYCVRYGSLSYDDGSVGDLFTGSDYPAWGVKIRLVKPNGDYTSYWTAWTGPDKGCATIQTDDTINYTVKVMRQAKVDWNIIEVRGSPTTGLYSSTVATNFNHVLGTSTTWTLHGAAVSKHIIAAASKALFRRSGGIQDTFVFITDACPSSPNTSCEQWPDAIYMHPLHDDLKFIIAHELGHAMFQIANDGNDSLGGSDADPDLCSTHFSYDTAHKMNSKEFQNVAANEGAAHFYSAIAFNHDEIEFDCDLELNHSADWDTDGSIIGEQRTISCEGGLTSLSTVIDAKDYLGDFCLSTGVSANRGTEYDWLRMLWDFHTEAPNVNFGTILDIWDEADPHTWQSDGDTQTSDSPHLRMKDAVDTVGGSSMLIDYSGHANSNGTNR